MRAVRRLHEWARHQAWTRPDAVAVTLGEDALTYGALDELSNAVASLLRGAGCRPGDRAALLAPRAPRTVAAALGVYKAGALLVPLDPEGPAARQEKVLRSSGSRFLLAGGGAAGARRAEEALLRPGLPEDLRLGWLESSREIAGPRIAPAFTGEDVDRLRGTPPPAAPAGSEDAAHILFTSGSTGEPKGVVVRHESVIRFVEWGVRHFGIEPGERLSGHSPLHFDLSTFDLFAALATGAELHLIPPELNLLPHRLAELIRRSRLTQWFSVPSVLNYMARFDVVEQGDFPALRRVLWCGEVFPTPALIHWMERLPHARFTNLYGPTETTIASSFHDVPRVPGDECEPIPIGRPCAGEELLVLDRDLRSVPPGEQGELYIRGVGL
ncbi:MAG: AMP-binding protein, partial [Thermoanaerobaculia bacterium]